MRKPADVLPESATTTEIIRFGLLEIADLAPGLHGEDECYDARREIKDYAQDVLRTAGDAGSPRITSIDDAVALLNEALRLEPRAISDLVRARAEFTSCELADHPTIQVGVKTNVVGEQAFDVGLVGLLNGIFGTDTDRISIQVDDDFYENPFKLVERFNAHHEWPSDIEKSQ